MLRQDPPDTALSAVLAHGFEAMPSIPPNYCASATRTKGRDRTDLADLRFWLAMSALGHVQNTAHN